MEEGTISTTGKVAFLSLSQLLPSYFMYVNRLPFPEGGLSGLVALAQPKFPDIGTLRMAPSRQKKAKRHRTKAL